MYLFEWDEGNRDHIALHAVQPAEAEEALNGIVLELDYERVDGEERSSQLGQTNSGRILKVVVTLRGSRLRVVTAYDVNRSLKAAYLDYARGFYE